MTAVLCNQCFRNIFKNNQKTSALWVEVCKFFVKMHGNFKLNEEKVPYYVPHFKTLETMGYISTKDESDGINLRVNGCECNNDDYGFCIDRRAHKDSWENTTANPKTGR